MEARIATVIGGTGLIGSHLIEQLKEDTYYTTIRMIVRRPVEVSHPKIEVKLVNFADHEGYKLALDGSAAVFCAIGTTTKKVKGDKAAYRKIDYEIPVHAAQFCEETNCPHFLLVSSVGANSTSRNFYLQLKGEVEDDVLKKKIKNISIFRPSILLGKRNESRPGEKIGQGFMQAFSFLFPSRYHPIQAKDVAKAMIAISKKEDARHHIYQYEEMKNYF